MCEHEPGQERPLILCVSIWTYPKGSENPDNVDSEVRLD